MNRAGECASCPAKKIYNLGTDSCECIFNYYPNDFDGSCQKCNSESDHVKCTTFGEVAHLELWSHLSYLFDSLFWVFMIWRLKIDILILNLSW